MVNNKFDIVGIGNAIVDILYYSDDEFLNEQNFVKGSMTIIGSEKAEAIYSQMEGGIEMSGGSAANTIACFSSLGGSGAFIGKICDDKLGNSFASDIGSGGVVFQSEASSECAPTARCFIFVTPDAERTMLTFLGASTELSPDDINENLISDASLVYLEGYLFDPPKAKEAFVQAAKLAKKHGCKVSLSLSDTFCVDRHRPDFTDFIKKHVDILFANEDEVMSLYQTNSLEKALHNTQDSVDLAAITRGSQGSVVVSGETTFLIEPESSKRVVDTTGAGDSYAAGFLYGFIGGHDLQKCGRLGSILSSEIISDFGARPRQNLKALLNKASD